MSLYTLKYVVTVLVNIYVFVLQVQNMSVTIDVLDQRTQRDLKFVENMEFQLKTLETKFKEVEDGHESNTARQYKVCRIGDSNVVGTFPFVSLKSANSCCNL